MLLGQKRAIAAPVVKPEGKQHSTHATSLAPCGPRGSSCLARARVGISLETHADISIGRHKPIYKNANFPTDAEGRTYHLGTKEGEVAPRILSVGSVSRAQLLSTLLDAPAPGKPLFQRTSSRGFLTITGLYEGQPVSIVSTHMGMPNMDFVVRENRAVVRGQMAIVRLGTCGAVQRPAKLGDLLIASHGSISIRRDPDYWSLLESASHHHTAGNGDSNCASCNNNSSNMNGLAVHASINTNGATAGTNGQTHGAGSNSSNCMIGRKPYTVAMRVPADAQLAALLAAEAERVVGAERVVHGLNASADSFYSSQGRTGSDFDDRNEGLLGELVAAHPDLVSLEMETFQLLDLARCSRGSIKAIGMCVALAERYSNAFLEYSKLEELEISGGTAALRALVRLPLDANLASASVATRTTDEGAGTASMEERRVQYVWE
ncbi:hypothetical protein Agub_g14691 [Astrephomene gubernaculifera]|uniref:Nucleoside phosphorylase domain-containing protein n=1 Tax=Astrephomene gubernaculifera TaxID=47775 RepID=A0AAD3HTM2_9CHLO|nr:hypothetical protein Agub_g14691 [Astrephomene gubernaculifera]